MSEIRIEVGTATVRLDASADVRRADGNLDVNYLVGDLLAATEFALVAANRRDLAESIKALGGGR